jgi:4-amino-4-deoxychorismate lyase
LMRDVDENIVCGTMSNLFMRSGSLLLTPALDRCGVAGVMRRWILETAGDLRLKPVEGRIRWQDLSQAEEVFMSNALVGLRSVGSIHPGTAPPRGVRVLRPTQFDAADRLRRLLDSL